MKVWLFRQIQEIEQDRVLRYYGGACALFVVITCLFWATGEGPVWLAKGGEGICWPVFHDCQSWRILSQTQALALFGALAALSALTAGLFVRSKHLGLAFSLLIAINVLKHLVILSDYRFRMTQHISTFWITLVFLFLPRKKLTIQVVILLVYFSAGLLKLNGEWLQGSSLYGQIPFLNGASLAWACTFVVLLEVVLIWGLVSRRAWLRWATLAQLTVFHVISIWVVGFYYPLLMFTVLSIYPLAWAWSEPGSLAFLQIYRHASIVIAITVFAGLQLLPRFMPGDTALTGEGRLFALHMFDSRVECAANAKLTLKNGQSGLIDLYLPLAVRIRCDPAVYLSRARRLCQSRSDPGSNILELDLVLKSKKSDWSPVHTVLDIKSFCSKQVSYNLFSHNRWIQTQ